MKNRKTVPIVMSFPIPSLKFCCYMFQNLSPQNYQMSTCVDITHCKLTLLQWHEIKRQIIKPACHARLCYCWHIINSTRI